MAHRFTCGEKKIWQNIEKSQNIMKLIAVRDFTKEMMVHKDDFIRFVDKRITKNNDKILYSGNVQFEAIIQPV